MCSACSLCSCSPSSYPDPAPEIDSSFSLCILTEPPRLGRDFVGVPWLEESSSLLSVESLLEEERLLSFFSRWVSSTSVHLTETMA
jgi:hypothetical protein